jgi:L-2-hydroxyglutarate oxidase LhgO
LETVDAIVVGAGVVGLAAARALALAGHGTIIVEAEAAFGSGTSSRNSEVVHAGLYYPAGSLKARLCVEGRERLYAYCESRGVAHRRIGKLVFAAEAAQCSKLDAIEASGRAAGVSDLQRLGPSEVRRLEPALDCVAALLSPSSGIVDSHALMVTLLGDAEARGATLACGTRVSRVTRRGALWQVHIEGEPRPVVAAPWLVNAAGLGAQLLAARIDGVDATAIPPLYLARGVYFTYSGRVPFSRLIYPVPEPGGLGTHLTLDLAGRARFGPDVEWVERIDYAVDPRRHAAFAAAARRIWPGLDPNRLQPGYAGIRPKIVGPGQPAGDFLICGSAQHGQQGLVNLFGIESPGLTASLAIADEVLSTLRKCG